MANLQCERLIDYFNGDLNEIEKRAFEAHLLECEECREELNELQMLTDDLPFASEPVNPPVGMKERILNNVFADEKASEGKIEEKRETVPVTDLRSRGSKMRFGKWAPFLAAALLLSLIGNVYALLSENPSNGPDKGKLSIESAIQSVTLKPTGVIQNSEARATMLKTDEGRVKVVLVANDLKQLQGSEVYQVWLIDGKTPYRAGTFVPDQQGSGGVAYTMNLPKYHKWDKIAISIEPTSKSQTPQGKIVLVSGL
ncbi:MAG TPA: anti-sigma factor [Bacillales bacterium]|nr:anti-sigma factor [Bacillales bacterium]